MTARDLCVHFLLGMKRVLFLVIVSCMMLLTTSSVGCRDPYDFAPPQDTLYAPPDPPPLETPMDKYVFMTPLWEAEDGRFTIEILMSWDTVHGAEIYELELMPEDLPPSIILCEENSYCYLIINDLNKLREYQWHVRAGSTEWDAMTAWSEQRNFEARLQPAGPYLLEPWPDTTIIVDSVPVIIDLHWEILSDEQFYEVRVYNHGVLLDSAITYEKMYECVIDTAETYAWQVRAGSPFWQLFSYPVELRYFTIEIHHRPVRPD